MVKIYNPRPVGPGPAGYTLPTTVGCGGADIRNPSSPGYSLGGRTKIPMPKGAGPGPAGYMLPQNLNQIGKPWSPSYSFGKRTTITFKNKDPGPGAHNNHLSKSFTGTWSPQYSFGRRIPFKLRSQAPPPNSYSVDAGTKLSKPGPILYGFGRRIDVKLKSTSPGPATYGRQDENYTKTRLPAYSLGVALKPIVFKNQAPASNAYNLQHSNPNPGYMYSFGVKHHQFNPPFIVPCDN